MKLRKFLTLQPVWQQFIIVLLFNSFVALFFYFVINSSSILDQMIISHSIGLSIFFSYMVFSYFFDLKSWRMIIPLLVGIGLFAIVITVIRELNSASEHKNIALLIQTVFTHNADLLQTLFAGLFFGAIIVYIFTVRERALANANTLQQEQIQNLNNSKLLGETQLRLLQAQIEPHFLFNTLSNIIGLIESKPDKARNLLENLTLFLRSSLKRSQDVKQCLRTEIDLITNYLGIFKARLGERLDYRIIAPAHLLDLRVPSMLIQPLVENAIIHGLETQPQGGRITIKLASDETLLHIQVCDDGSGLQNDFHSGFGLNNIRERLQSLYGSKAALRIEANQPHGVCATVEIARDAI